MKSFKNGLLTLAVLSSTFNCFAQTNTEGVSIKSSVAPPHPSAMLEIDNSNKGLLIPRVALLANNNTTLPISNPALSLLVYNTATSSSGIPVINQVTPGYYFFDGTLWQRLLNSSSTSGNSLWSNIGTTNDIFYNTGNVRVGASSPTPNSRFSIFEPSYNKAFYIQGSQGSLTFEGYKSTDGYASYLTQTCTGVLGGRYEHVYSDGAKGLNFTSFGQNAAPTIAARYSVVDGGTANSLYLTSVNGVAIYTGAGWTGQFYFNTDGTTSFTSDSTLKTNVTSLTPVLNKVLQCRPVLFNWKSNPNSQKNHGFIAQEIEQIFPELVSVSQSRVDSVVKTVKTVNYTGFTTILIQAIKEQQSQIEELKQRISALENK